MATLPIGVHLPPADSAAVGGAGPALSEMACLAEGAGVESVWVSDHTVLIEEPASRYPFSQDGRFFAPPDSDWYDWVVTLAYLGALTSRVRLGVAVAVLPHRNPVILAKQLATLDRLTSGRITLGIGAGWLEEEFNALGVPFRGRGRTMDAAVDVLRAVWTGAPSAGKYGPFTIPAGVHTRPTPVQEHLPILVGGESAAALRRIATRGDGWFGTIAGGRMSAEHLGAVVARLHEALDRAGRERDEVEITLRVAARAADVRTSEFPRYLRSLVSAGATRLTFDIGWRSAEAVPRVLERLVDIAESIER
jgi:probable F420-dependent oxidoreductase